MCNIPQNTVSISVYVSQSKIFYIVSLKLNARFFLVSKVFQIIVETNRLHKTASKNNLDPLQLHLSGFINTTFFARGPLLPTKFFGVPAYFEVLNKSNNHLTKMQKPGSRKIWSFCCFCLKNICCNAAKIQRRINVCISIRKNNSIKVTSKWKFKKRRFWSVSKKSVLFLSSLVHKVIRYTQTESE